MRKKIGLVLLINICAMIAWAGVPKFHFRHYTVEDGLSSNSIRSLIQDQRGYIWLGTENGLNGFDGIQIKDYSKGYEHGPGNNTINAMHEEANGTIWLATDVGVFSYFPREERFQRLNIETEEGVAVSSICYTLAQDKDQNIWFSTYGQGIFKYNKKNNKLIRFEIEDCSNNIYCAYIDSDNNVWATGNPPGNESLYRLNKTNNSFEPFLLKYAPGERCSNTLIMVEDLARNLWLGTRETGLQKVDRYSGEVTTYLSPLGGDGIRHIHSITEIDYQTFLIGSDQGLTLFNSLTGERRNFLPDEADPFSLSDQFIYPIVKDKEGGMWIGSYYGGVNYVSPRNGQFEGFSATKYANSVGGNIISCFTEDAHGNIWIGSDDGGMSCYSPQSGTFTNYLPQEGKNSLTYHNIHALCFDDNDLWIGTYTGGLNVLDTQTGKFRYYLSSEDANSLDQNNIYSIFKDKEKNMWVTTMSGVNLYNREKDNFIRVKNFGHLTMDIKQDHRGNLWFATQGKGVFRLDTSTQSWTNYQHSGKENSLNGNMVNCLHIDSHGDVWIGTTDGLCKYRQEDDSIERIELSIQNQNICCIIEEEEAFWITTAKGLVHYIPGEGSLVFTQSDGLQSDLFLPASGIKASDGKIYLGSVKGFNAFYPHRIRPNEFIPPVVLTGLEIFNREIPVSPGSLLPVPLNELDKLELSYRDNVFSIRYAALSYSIPEKNRFVYKLEGFDRHWNQVGTQNKATYTNLPAGTYTFRVKASNNDGVWNEEGAKLKIVIHPPFYLTAGFKVLYFVLTCISVFFIFRFLMKRTEKKHVAEMEELGRQKEKEMHEAKISFFTIIAHEIRTPVSLIIGPLEKIMTSYANLIPDNIKSDLNVIDRNSQRLLSLVNQLLDFRKVESGGMKLKLEQCNMAEVISAVSVRFTPWVTQKGAKFTVDSPANDATATVDREAITKLISNLLTNASKYTKDEVTLSCRFLPEEEQFTITVADNGCGISPEEKEKIFQAFYQAADNKPGTGIGLSIVRNIVDAHRGTIEVVSEEGKGSSFIVTLPIRQSAADYPQEEQPLPEEEKLPEDILSDSPTEEAPATKPVMLIVDDNDEMLSFLTGSFEEEYTILTAEDGKEATGLLEKNEVALIVSDWMMPRMNGVELCRVVRSNPTTSHIPFILLTAKTDVHSKIEGMECGADIYVDKPFSLQYLKSCIRNLMDLRQMLFQKFSQMPLVPIKSIAANQADEQFLTRMNEIIEENFSNPDLSVDFLADKLCISRSGLFAKIKTLAQATPNELIQVVRLKKAAVLLSENKYRINEISYMVGFNNPSYFSKCFQKQFGMKPGEFLKREQQTEKNE